ncbi:MAG: hypothetical protein JJT85_10780 [Chromatiales bacterium]|nr:hypothetical protein [Chromatiales bacterium]
MASRVDGEISLVDFWSMLWKQKWLVLGCVLLFGATSVIYALAATPWYRAEVLLAPVEPRPGQALDGQLSGLAQLAGVSVAGGNSVEALATLRSRAFLREFIQDRGLLLTLLADSGRAPGVDPAPGNGGFDLDIRDATNRFREQLLSVSEDRRTGLVSLSVDWTDPELAADWAQDLAERLNARLRKRALEEAESNIAYLQQELAATTVVTLQQSIGRLLEGELQTFMLARGSSEFAFRVIDPAEVPMEPIRPRRALLSILGVFVGFMAGVLAALCLSFAEGARSRADS